MVVAADHAVPSLASVRPVVERPDDPPVETPPRPTGTDEVTDRE
jgi:hypothetical protein